MIVISGMIQYTHGVVILGPSDKFTKSMEKWKVVRGVLFLKHFKKKQFFI